MLTQPSHSWIMPCPARAHRSPVFDAQRFPPVDDNDLHGLVVELIKAERRKPNGSTAAWTTKPFAGHLRTELRCFCDDTQAHAYLKDKATPLGPLIGLKVLDDAGLTSLLNDKANLAVQRDNIQASMDALDASVYQRLRALKRERRSCNRCQSTISLAFVTDLNCPVCAEPRLGYSAVELKQYAQKAAELNAITGQMAELDQRITSRKANARLTGQWHWLVGGWAPA